PELGTRGFDKSSVALREDLYLRRLTLRNAIPSQTHDSLRGYQVQGFALTESPTVRLLTGYYAGVPQFGADQILELRANQIQHSDLQLAPCTPDSFSCPAPAREVDVAVPPSKTLDNGLLQGWERSSRGWLTPVEVRRQPRWECLQAPDSDPPNPSGCPQPKT